MSEWYTEPSFLLSVWAFLYNTLATARPKYAPKAWINIDPPTSTACEHGL